ncbi:MAG: malectin domain-containing carbohydrate-binding protein [Bacteroidales bacterium]
MYLTNLKIIKKHTLSFFLIIISLNTFAQSAIRKDILLNSNWRTVACDTNQSAYAGFELSDFNDADWEKVNIPHNWDKYEGYRRMLHGNRHGFAWYRKRFSIGNIEPGKRYFLWFEGAGSYATVYINGHKAAYHAGGRTSFTVDITPYILNNNQTNILAVRTDHPANIRDLPWVCGGCSEEWGFSEGSQPMGIFRPVHLIVTGDVRIEPFGTHIWNDTTINEDFAELHVETEVKNYAQAPVKMKLITRLKDKDGLIVASDIQTLLVNTDETIKVRCNPLSVPKPHLWSPENPYLYTLESEIKVKRKTIDFTTTKYGIRWISWPIGQQGSSGQFLLNGKSYFLNGTAEYEHMMGQSHAFSQEQVKTRVMQIKAAGFNAFRDAHQPHNLYYQHFWDSLGIFFWPQFAAHIWFDNNDFKEKFKQLLKDWVKERRNCPSVILWGLENESTLPEWFARECTQIIRELDPTTSSQRKVTTCNGGTGTDWNVIQNWSGTYAGDLYKYDEDLAKDLLNGEYGAWRSIDLHSEGGFIKEGIHSENRMCAVMETKIRLGEAVRDKSCGHFQWIFNSHENPGRTQNGEGYREIDRVGPVNYKGLITAWGEPADVFYLYRSNYAPKENEPMVYIVSHTWPDRWTSPGIKQGIEVYSNCDEVELFNDVDAVSLGKKSRNRIGEHFMWDSVIISYNVLYAKGYVDGNVVATDCIVLNHLPESPGFGKLSHTAENPLMPESGYNYIYRVNCGGPDYTDELGNFWMADRHKSDTGSWGSLSWTDDFEGLPSFYGSQRRTFDPLKGSNDWKLFQTFRYGRDKLRFEFPLPDGNYLVELFFIEPWYGTAGGIDCRGWRLFTIAANNDTLIKNLDIYNEVGHNKLLKKKFITSVKGGKLVLHFPEVFSGQAIISAIAVASLNQSLSTPVGSASEKNFLMKGFSAPANWELTSWLDTGEKLFSDAQATISYLPSNLFGSVWIRTPKSLNCAAEDTLAQFVLQESSDIFIAVDTNVKNLPAWMDTYQDTKTYLECCGEINSRFKIFGNRYQKGTRVFLGGFTATSPMYSVIITPVTNLGLATDQRPVARYPVTSAILWGPGIIKNYTDDQPHIIFSAPVNDAVEWDIAVGIGDLYSLQFRYMNNTPADITMKLTIKDHNYKTVYTGILEFVVTGQKWKTLKTNTVTSINAGKYKIHLSVNGAQGLAVSSLNVQ